jgi:hypothetical protein
MGQRALFIVLVLVVVVGLFAYFGYNSYDAKWAGLNGDVFSNDPYGAKMKLEPVSPAGRRTDGRISGPSGPGDPNDPGRSGDTAERDGDDAGRGRVGRYDQRESTERDGVFGTRQISALPAG